MLTLIQTLNNNIALARSEDDALCIAMGCGIAFGKKPGATLDESKIERLFTQDVNTLSEKFAQLARTIDEKYFEVAQDIIAHAKLRLGQELSDQIYLLLADHIHFAIERARQGIVLQNRLRTETKLVYPEEYACGMTALGYINRIFDVELPEDEAAFIALHLVNANLGKGLDTTYALTKLIEAMLTIIQDTMHIQVKEGSLAQYRLLIHLKFFALRIVEGDKILSVDDADKKLALMVQATYPEAARTARALAAFVEEQYKQEISPSEVLYLTVHLENVRKNLDKEKGV